MHEFRDSTPRWRGVIDRLEDKMTYPLNSEFWFMSSGLWFEVYDLIGIPGLSKNTTWVECICSFSIQNTVSHVKLTFIFANTVIKLVLYCSHYDFNILLKFNL